MQGVEYMPLEGYLDNGCSVYTALQYNYKC